MENGILFFWSQLPSKLQKRNQHTSMVKKAMTMNISGLRRPGINNKAMRCEHECSCPIYNCRVAWSTFWYPNTRTDRIRCKHGNVDQKHTPQPKLPHQPETKKPLNLPKQQNANPPRRGKSHPKSDVYPFKVTWMGGEHWRPLFMAVANTCGTRAIVSSIEEWQTKAKWRNAQYPDAMTEINVDAEVIA